MLAALPLASAIVIIWWDEGKHVNIAARLQALGTPGRTVISYATWLLVSEKVDCGPLGKLPLKGITRPVDAFEISSQAKPTDWY